MYVCKYKIVVNRQVSTAKDSKFYFASTVYLPEASERV